VNIQLIVDRYVLDATLIVATIKVPTLVRLSIQ